MAHIDLGIDGVLAEDHMIAKRCMTDVWWRWSSSAATFNDALEASYVSCRDPPSRFNNWNPAARASLASRGRTAAEASSPSANTLSGLVATAQWMHP